MSNPVIIIGSGPTGAIAAATLVREHISVVMLESGAAFPGGLLIRAGGRTVFRRRPRFESPKRHVSTGHPGALWFHDLTPGGLSNHWTGAVPRFAPEDFDEGLQIDERYRWPVTYEELVPYYNEVERLIGVSGSPVACPTLPASAIAHRRRLPADWRRVASHAPRIGRRLIPQPMADGPPWLVRRSATAFNSFAGIIRGLRSSPNFRLILGAHALKLERDSASRLVRSVTYFDRVSGSERRVEGAAVVLAAGALASTKLLLDSTSPEFPAGLGNSEGLLGKYLHDHVHDMCVVETDRPLTRLSSPAYLTRASYEQSKPLLATAATLSNRTSQLDRILTFTPLPTRRFGVVIFGTMVPRAENYVQPDPVVKDEFGLPALDIHIRYQPDELENAAAVKQQIIQMLEAAGHSARLAWSLPEPTPGTSVHYGGTIRMHSSPRYGMLDGWNRLHEVPNVLVVDASCFTTGVEKNPTLTAMTLATRAAERLAKDLKTGSMTRSERLI